MRATMVGKSCESRVVAKFNSKYYNNDNSGEFC